MAIVIDIQPQVSKICSTIIPLVLEVTETTASTTNIIASCYWVDQTSGAETQIGAKYRMAPNLASPDKFIFDSSEIFNSLTKYTLNDAPNNWKLGANNYVAPYPLGIANWEQIATWKVRVKFQREYISSTTGLIVLDPSFTLSNFFYIHEGSPEQKWLTQIVKSNGGNDSVFDAFMLSFQNAGDTETRRLLTNYPILKSTTSAKYSNVTIHESEQFIFSFFPNISAYDEFKVVFITKNESGGLLTLHDLVVDESQNLHTVCVGFRDLISTFTASAGEGTDFINVASYFAYIQCSNVAGGGSFVNQSTIFDFKVDRSCIKNVGYLRFCFKNMMGGFDMVTSRGKYNKKVRNKFDEFEKTLGYYSWTESQSFGNTNWANENAVRYSVKTQPMKPEYAAHFAEMFSSTDVYLREANDSSLKIWDNVETQASIDVPYKFNSIFITAGSQSILKSDDNLVILEFEFTMSVNQRNPRY